MIHTARKALIACLLFFPLRMQAQLTEIFTEADRPYKTGWELYTKEKFGAARTTFDSYIRQGKGSPHHLLNAEYYRAICAFELFHPDAENLLLEFTEKYPESNKAPLAWFYLGRHYYRTKKYSKALPALEKADIYYLSGDAIPEYYFKLGYCCFQKGDNERAAKSFLEILNVKSKYQTSAQYYYAHIAYANNNYKTALEYFGKLDSSATFGPLVPSYITQIYFEQGKYDEVIRYAVPVLKEKSPQNNTAIMRTLAEAYYRKGDYTNALVWLEGYAQATPVLSREDEYLIGYCKYKKGDYTDAISHFEKISLAQDSLAQNAAYHLAGCYLKTNNKQAARNSFQVAGKLNYDARVREPALFNFAKLSYELRLPGGLDAFREFLEAYPSSNLADEANELLAELYLKTRNYKDALSALESVKTKTARSKAAYQKVAYFRGVELFNDGENDKAISMFEKAILEDVDPVIRAQAMYWKAEVLYRQNKFDAAYKQYRIFLFNPGSVTAPNWNLANYNIGYCQFKLNNYDTAQTWFRKYLAKSDKSRPDIYNDALVRTGDCFYASRAFDNALDYYSQAISAKAASADYALFQKGVIQGLQGNLEAKQQTMSSILSGYPKSKYRADALFERGRALMTKGESAKAIESFQSLLREFPSSQYAVKSQLSIGLIYFNDQQDEQALQQFKKVVSTYPGTPEAAEALSTIKNIYVADGKSDDYFAYVKTVPNASVSTGAQDSITYEAAEQRYLKSNFEEASRGFQKYLTQFPAGAYRLNATFYKAECDYRSKNFSAALEGYEKILNEPRNIFTEKSLSKAAQINLSNKEYSKATSQFERLESIADLRDNVIAAQAGIMRAAFAEGKHEKALQYSQKLSENEKISNELLNESHLIAGRSAMALNDYVNARKEFGALTKQSSEAAAEARYQIAFIEYKLGNFKSSQNKCYEIANDMPSYDFWIGKSFLLVAENFLALKDTFQAKATLQSLIDNYERDASDAENIRDLANDRLLEIVNSEPQPLKPEEKEIETDLNKEQKP